MLDDTENERQRYSCVTGIFLLQIIANVGSTGIVLEKALSTRSKQM